MKNDFGYQCLRKDVVSFKFQQIVVYCDTLYIMNCTLWFSVLMVVDRETGASKGFAFVTFANPKDAEDAVSGMNETVSVED